MTSIIQQYTDRFLWGSDTDNKNWFVANGLAFCRYLYALIRDFLDGQLTLRAMGLVYTTLLSIVPLVAFVFSILKGFGVHQQVRPLLLQLMTPLGEKGIEITDRIIGFVDNVRVDALAIIGFLILMYTVVSLVQKVENSFNFIWHANGPRSIGRRFSEYLSVIMVGPLLMAVAVGAGASITNSQVVQYLATTRGVDTAIIYLGKLMPFALVTGTFTFLYAFIPNTRVKLIAAFIGGITAGLLWVTVGFLFASFVAGSTKYTAIYSSFAILILFLIWLYLGWLILMIGAQISFYYQNPEYLRHGRVDPDLSNASRERMSLEIMSCIGLAFMNNDKAWTSERLARHFSVPGKDIDRLLNRLRLADLIVDTDQGTLMPARALDAIAVTDVLKAVRLTQNGSEPMSVYSLDSVNSLMDQIEDAIVHSLDNMTLRDLLNKQASLN